jgi:hypothetical protein
MLNSAKYLTFSLFFLGILWACNKPNYSKIPAIELVEIRKYITDFGLDSLVFEFNFKDGDADLGLNSDEPPFSDFEYVFDAFGDSIRFDFNDPDAKFSCKDWNSINFTKIRQNLNFYNLFIKIDVKRGNNYIETDNSCLVDLNAYRFSRLAPKDYKSAIDVKFTYYAVSDLISAQNTIPSQLIGLNERDIIRFRIKIKDRAGNYSNEVVSQDFKLRP